MDLYVFDASAPDDDDEVRALLGDESGWELAPGVEALISELEERYPDLDDGTDSPWASWPLRQPVANGTGCELNLTASHADEMRAEIVRRSRELGLVLYDLEADRVIRPTDIEPIADPGLTTPSDLGDPAAPKRRWWKRDP